MVAGEVLVVVVKGSTGSAGAVTAAVSSPGLTWPPIGARGPAVDTSCGGNTSLLGFFKELFLQ